RCLNLSQSFFSHSFPSLLTLHLNDCDMTDTYVSSISKNCKSLLRLFLEGNHRLVTLGALEPLPLLELDLRDCKRLSDKALENIGVNFSQLIDVNLSNCHISQDGLTPLVSRCHNLKSLNLNG